MVKTGVLFTSGTNCDEETIYAFRLVGAQANRLYLKQLKENPKILLDYHILCLPGGFTYGDYLGAGKILANILKFYLKDILIEFYNRGNLILGICNGFQILVKAGLLPDFSFTEKTSLVTNDSNKFECRWVYLKVNPNSPCIFTKGLDFFSLPVAHAEGKFVVDNEHTLNKIIEKNLMVLTYTNKEGQYGNYPYNPNGSICNIAGICDPSGRVFGLMPHPERASLFYQYPLGTNLSEALGITIFKNAVYYVKKNL
ncbi:MAG: phosphoribosylformylglycinamidine synthase I [candidate division WOR-3 bacterium]|nr:phosphoribosylformylglycinamidine synthase I [candidate division WOR-3 bacterium]